MNKERIDLYLDKNPFEQLSNIVFNIIEDEITSLKLKPGTKLNISKISEDMALSRTPVREALARLYELGYVVKQPDKQGYYVSELCVSDVMQTYFIREIIESKAAFLCAKQHNWPNLNKLKHSATDFKNTIKSDSQAAATADLEFHNIIVQACSNEYMVNFYNLMQKKITRLLRLNTGIIVNNKHKHIADRLIAEHNAIINTICANMPELAEKEMINHINTSTNNTLLFSDVVFNL